MAQALGQIDEVKVIHADGSEGTTRLKCVGLAGGAKSTEGEASGTVQGQSGATP